MMRIYDRRAGSGYSDDEAVEATRQANIEAELLRLPELVLISGVVSTHSKPGTWLRRHRNILKYVDHYCEKTMCSPEVEQRARYWCAVDNGTWQR